MAKFYKCDMCKKDMPTVAEIKQLTIDLKPLGVVYNKEVINRTFEICKDCSEKLLISLGMVSRKDRRADEPYIDDSAFPL
jgi:hypothetical protein